MRTSGLLSKGIHRMTGFPVDICVSYGIVEYGGEVITFFLFRFISN